MMNIKTIASVCGLLTLLGSSALLAQSSSKPSKKLVLEESTIARQITLTRGGELMVNLRDTPSTGYGWETVTLPGALKLKSDASDAPAVKGMVGGTNTRHLTYTALKPGKGTLKLVYRRAWEKNVPPVRVFTVQVTVK